MTILDWENLKIKYGDAAYKYVDFMPLKTNNGLLSNNHAVEVYFKRYKNPPKLKSEGINK